MNNRIPDWRQIKLARVKLGMSIETAAAGVCSPSYLSLIENGKRPLTWKTWQGLEKVLGTQVFEDTSFHEARVYDEMTTAVRLLKPLTDRFLTDLETPLVLALRLAIENESRGDLPTAAQAYRSLYTVGMSDLKTWSDYCSGAEWSFRMLVFVTEQLTRLEADSNRLEVALATALPIIEMAKTNGHEKTDELRTLMGLVCGIYSEFGNAEASDRMLSEMDSTAESERERALGLWLRGQLLLDRGMLMESAFVLRSAAELLRGLALKSTQYRLTNAAVWSECLADTPLSVSAFEELNSAVGYFRANENPSDLASCLNTLAFLAARLGYRQLAVESNLEAAELSRILSGPRKASLLSGLAMVCMVTSDHELALEYLRMARDILEAGDFGRKSATIWAQMSHIYEEIGDTPSAVVCLKASLECLGVSGAPLAMDINTVAH